MFQSKIANLMKKQGKPPRAVANASGLAKNTVIRLMKPIDLGKISLRTLVKIATALNCKVKDLFEKKGD
jgi:DNA-binding Xre family transcriptional regulator